MEQSKSGAPLNSPLYFDKNNYSHWKARMMFFLKMQGENVWNWVEYGWKPHLILDAQGISIGELKPKNEWDNINNEGSEANVIALLVFLTEFVLMSFIRLQITNRQRKHGIYFKSLMKVRSL